MPKGKFIELMDDMHLSNSELFQNYYNNVASRNISGASQIIENNEQLQNQITDSDNVNKLIERVNSNEQQIKTDVDEYLQDQLNAFQDLINQTKVAGKFNAATQYELHNLVYYQDKGYYAYKTPPIGTLPTNTNYWLEYDIRGLKGYGGLNLNYRFTWNADIQYQVMDCVVYQNKLWFANQPSKGSPPTLAHYPWLPIMMPLEPVKAQISTTQPTIAMSTGDFWFKITKGDDIKQTKWTDKAKQTYFRYASAVFTFGNEIHICGGDNSLDEKQTEHQVYNTLTNTWSEKVALPVGISGMASFTIGNKGYSVGGINASLVAIPTTYIYDNTSNTWSTGGDLPIALVPLMSGCSGIGKNLFDETKYSDETLYSKGTGLTGDYFAYVKLPDSFKTKFYANVFLKGTIQNKLVIGFSNNTSAEVTYRVYDKGVYFENKECDFTNAENVYFAIGNSDMVTIDTDVKTIFDNFNIMVTKEKDNIYEPHEIGYFATSQTANNLPSNVTFSYNPSANTWKQLADCPNYLMGANASYCNGKIYVMGGVNPTGSAGDFLYIYDIATNTWSQGASEGINRSFASAFVIGNKIYRCGGLNILSYSMSNVMIYDTETNTWAKEVTMEHKRTSAQATAVNGKGYVIGGININNDFGVFGYNEEYNPEG